MARPEPTQFPPIRMALTLWGLGAGLYLIGFFQRVAPAVITRELMAELRELGGVSGGPPPFARRDRSRFLHALDEAIHRTLRR